MKTVPASVVDRRGLAALFEAGSEDSVKVPEGDPASAALRALFGSLGLRQFETHRAAATMRGHVRQPR